MDIFGKKHKGMTLVEMMIVVIIIGIVSGYAFVNASVYTEKARYARAAQDISMIGTAAALSYLESDESWHGVEGVSSTGKPDAFKELLTNDGGNATRDIDRKLNKPTAMIRDPWGQPYDLVVKPENGKTALYILCRPGAAAVNSPDAARIDKYNDNRPMWVRITID